MGNTLHKENTMSEKTHEYYLSSHYNSSQDVKDIREKNKYKVIDVDYFVPDSSIQKNEKDIIVADSKVFSTSRPNMAFDMMDFCFKDEHDRYYQTIDYVCNEKEGVCICNTHADDFRKIYDGINYKSGRVHIVWVKKKNERF